MKGLHSKPQTLGQATRFAQSINLNIVYTTNPASKEFFRVLGSVIATERSTQH
jgi:hypothetical protein